MPRYVMAIDAAKCTSCMACVMACKLNNHVPPDKNRNWVRALPLAARKSGYAFQPGACMHCADPLCVKACPTRATYIAADHSIQIDPEICIACGSCIAACPYGARYMNTAAGHADKCDYCRDSMRRLGKEPACVSICPTRARVFGDANDPGSEISRALAVRTLNYVESAQTPTKPTLAYLGPVDDKNWPQQAAIPTPIALIGPVTTAARWLGGLALLGVVGVFVRNLVAPEQGSEDSHE